MSIFDKTDKIFCSYIISNVKVQKKLKLPSYNQNSVLINLSMVVHACNTVLALQKAEAELQGWS